MTGSRQVSHFYSSTRATRLSRMSLPSLPTFLNYLPQCKVILCQRHRCTFTSQDLGVHLEIFHGYSARRGKHVSAAARELGAASARSGVKVPVNGSPANSNLNSYRGHQCQVVIDCQCLGVGRKAFRDHLQKKHGIGSGTGWAPHRQVILQCLLARSISPAYFVVGKRGPIMTEIAPRDTGASPVEHKRKRDELSADVSFGGAWIKNECEE